jgi:hypothetical protein
VLDTTPTMNMTNTDFRLPQAPYLLSLGNITLPTSDSFRTIPWVFSFLFAYSPVSTTASQPRLPSIFPPHRLQLPPQAVRQH